MLKIPKYLSLQKRLIGRFRTFFSGKKAVNPDAEELNGPMEGEEDHWVHLSLEEVLKRDPELVVHVVTLAQFRAAVGPAWDKMKDKAILLAEATLRKVAGHGNPVRAIGQEGVFLLTFPRLSPADGLRRAAEAAIAVGQHLVGERFSIVGDGQVPLTCMASTRGGDLLSPLGELTPDTVDALATAAMPISEKTAIHTEALHNIQESTTQHVFRISGKENAVPEWVPLPHESTQHHSEITEQASPIDEKNPDWEKQELRREKDDHTFVKIKKDERHKTSENVWVPIRK